MKIIVTGCFGFIGFHVCKTLLDSKANHEIVGIDCYDILEFNALHDSEELLQEKRFVCSLRYNALYHGNRRFTHIGCDLSKSSILQKTSINRAIEQAFDGADYVIHLAAHAGVRQSINNSVRYLRNNVESTINVLQLMEEFGVQNLFYASSSSVYGERCEIVSETMFSKPSSPYAASKVATEAFVNASGREVPQGIARLF